MYFRFCNPILDLNIFIILATVPTELQTCAKVLQMHLSGGGGHLACNRKVMKLLKKTHAICLSFLAAAFGF